MSRATHCRRTERQHRLRNRKRATGLPTESWSTMHERGMVMRYMAVCPAGGIADRRARQNILPLPSSGGRGRLLDPATVFPDASSVEPFSLGANAMNPITLPA